MAGWARVFLALASQYSRRYGESTFKRIVSNDSTDPNKVNSSVADTPEGSYSYWA